MRIRNTQAVSFTAAPTSAGLKTMDEICRQGEKLLHPNGSSTMFDVYHYSMYTDSDYDTGIGKYTGDESINFIKTMKPYVGFDTEKIYPIGRFANNSGLGKHFQCPYYRGSITIGEDNIDFKQLTTDRFSRILDKKDINEFVESNRRTRKSADRLNNENELGDNINFPINKLLYKAYQNFQKLDDNSPLKLEYDEYKKRPIVQNYDRLALYEYIADDEPDLFLNFNKNKKNQAKFEEYKTKYSDEIEFFKFKQFLGFTQMLEAKERYNKEGVEVTGDLPIGHSKEEFWALKDAFHQDKSIGYGFPLMRYYDMKDKNSPAYKLFKDEVTLIATLFDGVRLDVGTSYIKYNYFKKGNDGNFDETRKYTYDNKNLVSDIIEKTFKEIKGSNYDLSKITYEADGAPYSIDWTKGRPIIPKNFRNKNLIYSTQYEKPAEGNDFGYGSTDFFINAAKMKPNYLTIGTENHDGCSLRKMSEEKGHNIFTECRENSIPVLSKLLKLSKAFLKNPKNWVKAKFAELNLAPKKFLLFTDVMGENIDIDNCMSDESVKNRYRYRLTKDFEEKYNKALQNNDGYNRPEALAMSLKANGFDKSHADLYKKIKYMGEYLRQKGALSSAEADKKAAQKGQDDFLSGLSAVQN